MKNSNFLEIAIYIVLIVAFVFVIGVAITNLTKEITKETIKIISSTENKNLEEIIIKYANKNNINVQIDYVNTLELMDKLNSSKEYDAVWAPSSIWLVMLDNVSISNSKVISRNPVVFGIKKSKAKELGIVGKEIKFEDILNKIREENLKFAMPSPSQTNTGICAYLGFLNNLANNPETLLTEHLQDENVKNKLIALFNGTTRSSGSEEFLEEIYLNGKCDAMITYESSIIDINQNISDDKDTIYAIYIQDVVSTSDSVFAYLGENSTSKEEAFIKLQTFLLSDTVQDELIKNGRRRFDGSLNSDIVENIFNIEWGIDISQDIETVKMPSSQVIKKALDMYQSEFRKPTHVLFALDYSGSMTGEGNQKLREAMEYLLTKENASKDYLQFSSRDKISFIMFNSTVEDTVTIDDGLKTEEVLELINTKVPKSGTNIYDTVTEAVKLLNKENPNKYNVSVVLMTDGEGLDGDYNEMQSVIKSIKNNVPVYSIMYGNANDTQLSNISSLTGGKVFNGRENLLEAFKIVRGYN